MNYKKVEEKNYDIYLLRTNKFKTINISTVLINRYDEKDITKERFLNDYLNNSNNNYKDEVLLSKKYMELYEPRIDIYDIFNDVHSKIYTLSFLNEDYTEKGMNKKTIDFYYDIMFDINKNGNKLDKSNFDIVKKSMYSAYLREEEDSSSLAYFNAIKYIRGNLPIKIDPRGKKEDLNNIDEHSLLEYYNKKLKESKFLVFVVGNYNEDIITYIKNNLNKRVEKNDYEIKTEYNVTKEEKELIIKEESKFKQSIVYILYKIINITKREKNYVLPVLNSILGGSSGKLFNNVREKNSLAYYAYSNIHETSNVIYMYAGISYKNYDKCIELMKKQVDEIINGNITCEEIVGAKESIYSSLLKIDDSLSSISSSLKSHIILKKKFYTEIEKEIKTVTKEEIINLSKKLNLDVIYLYKGEE